MPGPTDLSGHRELPTPTGKFDIPKELDWDLWLGPAKFIDYNPAYLPFNWRGWWAFGTGALGDMACHIMDPIFRILPIDYPGFCRMQRGFHYTSKCGPQKIMWTVARLFDHSFNYPTKDGKGNIKVSWHDGGLLPERPEELLPDEPFGNWDGGVLFVGTKGKLLADCYGDNPRLFPTKLMKETNLPAETIARVPEGIICNG